MIKMAAAVLGAVAIGIAVASGRGPVGNGTEDPVRDHRAAATGRVEGRLEAVDLNPAIDGIVREVTVEEGAAVTRGQIIARIDCGASGSDRAHRRRRGSSDRRDTGAAARSGAVGQRAHDPPRVG